MVDPIKSQKKSGEVQRRSGEHDRASIHHEQPEWRVPGTSDSEVIDGIKADLIALVRTQNSQSQVLERLASQFNDIDDYLRGHGNTEGLLTNIAILRERQQVQQNEIGSLRQELDRDHRFMLGTLATAVLSLLGVILSFVMHSPK